MTGGEGATGNSRRNARLLIQWLIPVAILGLFVVSGHLGGAIEALSGVDPAWAILLVMVGIALPASHAWRWCYLLQRTGSRIPISSAARITSLASLLNYAAPGFLGAPAKAIFARDAHGIAISRSLPTLAVEQILDALMLAIAGGVAVLLTGPVIIDAARDSISVERSLWMVVLLAATGGLITILWIAGRRILPEFAGSLQAATSLLLRSQERLRPIGALTLTRWVLDMTAVGIASIAVGLRLSVIEVLLIANISLLAGLVSPVPGGLGVREAVMAALAGVIGVSIPAILALSVLHRAGLALGLPVVLAGARLYEWGGR